MAIVVRNGQAQVVPDNQPTTPPVASTPPPAEGGGFDLMGMLRGAAQQGFSDVTQHPLDLLGDLAKGAVSGTMNFAQALPDLFYGAASKLPFIGPGAAEMGSQVDQLFNQARQNPLIQPTTQTGKALQPLAEFAPALLAPESRIAEGPGLIAKLLGGLESGANFIAKSQAVYQPQDQSNQLGDRLTNIGETAALVGGTALLGGIFKKVVPMDNAFRMIKDNIVKFIRPGFTDATPTFVNEGINNAFNSGTATISKDDFINTVNGLQPINDQTRQFFSTPEWVSIVRQYKADYSGYPSELTVKLPEAATTAPIEGGAGLTPMQRILPGAANNPTDQLRSLVPEMSQAVASQDHTAVAAYQQAVNGIVADAKIRYGMNIDPQAVMGVVEDYANYIRRSDDLNAGVAHLEVTKDVYQRLADAGMREPLQLLGRLSGIIKGGAEDPFKVIDAYNKSGATKNYSTYDVLIRGLQDLGFNVKEPGDLVAFAKSMPTKTSIAQIEKNVKNTSVEAPDLATKISDVIGSPQAPRIDTPYQVAKPAPEAPPEVVNPTRAQIETILSPEEKQVLNEKPAGSLEKELSPAAFNEEKPIMSVDEMNAETATKPSTWERIKTKLIQTRLNPLAFEMDRIASYGPQGQEMVSRVIRAAADATAARSEFRNINKLLNFNGLTDEEWNNARQVAEGVAPAMSERVLNVVQAYKAMFNEWADRLQIPEDQRVAQYWPRGLNEAGKEHFQLLFAKMTADSTDPFIKAVMEKYGVDASQALKILNKAPRKGSFEYSRVLDDIPPEFRADPKTELLAWQEDASRRIGQINNFGKDNSIIRRLKDDLVLNSTGGSARRIANEVDDYYLKAIGKAGNYTDIGPILNFFRTNFIISKLSPITSFGNAGQGFVNSWLDHGVRGLIDTFHSASNRELIKQLGLNDIKGKFGDELDPEGLATKWMKLIRMESTEVSGFARSAGATQGALLRMWDELKLDPGNTDLVNEFRNRYAMFPDQKALQDALSSGKIPAEEMAYGLYAGIQNKMHFQIPGNRPAWAATPEGSIAWIFHNYLISQLRLIGNAPLYRQLAYVAVAAPLYGLPVMLLRDVITGHKMPQSPADWYWQSMSAGPGTAFDLATSLTSPDHAEKYALGGYSGIAGLLQTPFAKGNVGTNVGRAAINAVPLPAPVPSMLTNLLFPYKQNKPKP